MQEKMNNEQVKKTFKPVPDVECLKYHGTPEKPDIKIFVSHRIDKDSETIDNPLYIPVRCGAVYDDRENVAMLGDDTGDNISEKRESFCELTVMYWAWKNVKADYYGLCHYRRYISFADKSYRPKNDKSGFCVENQLYKKSIKKYSLDNSEKMISEITKYDIVTTPAEDVYYSWDGKHESMYKLCEERVRDFDMKGVDDFIQITKDKYPEYSDAVDLYFNGHFAKYYNCFIMKKEIFDEFCSMLFDILFELEKRLDTTYYNTWQSRMPGFMAENLFGIFYLHKLKNKLIKNIEKDLVFFLDAKQLKIEEIKPAFPTKNIPIVFSASDYFSTYSSVFIQSIIDTSSKENNYDLIILQKNISEQNKIKLENMVSNLSNFSIRFYDPSALLYGCNVYINSAVQSEEAYYRLLAPYCLSEYDKLLVMDCDLILMEDISTLYETDLENKIIAAVPDVVWFGHYNGATPKLREYQKKKFPIKNPYDYINTGVLLIDTKKWRKKIQLDDLLTYIDSNKFMIQEQDAINLLFEGQVKYLDIAWNMYACVAGYIRDVIDNFAPLYAKEAYNKAHDAPKIIHWAAQPKPWNEPTIDYALSWWAIAKRTCYYEIFISNLVTNKLGALHPAVLDLQNRLGIFDTRSGARKFADKLFPPGTKRREFAKKIVPKGSRRWNFCKKVYYFFRPSKKPR